MSNISGNRFIISGMKYSKQNDNSKAKARFRNVVVVFAVFLSILTFVSADRWSASTVGAEVISNAETVIDGMESTPPVVLRQDGYSTSHHNFLAAYLIQESSINRQSRKKKGGESSWPI